MKTNLIRGLGNLKLPHKHNVVTIGNFDGVHLGHQTLIQNVIEAAKKLNTQSMVVTFEPHPFEFFCKENLTIPRLTRLREKFIAIAKLGVDHICILPFNQRLAELSASDFIKTILHDALEMKHLVVGDDFRFGFKRSGDTELLKNYATDFNYTIETMPSILMNGERISSTSVRQALNDGDLCKAKVLLGRPYTMLGRIQYGRKLGRSIGFPTANIYLHRKLTPLLGVFTVFMHGILEKPIPGVANIGVRPTVDGTKTLLEVHLLDFNQDIYGKNVEIEFTKKLRSEVRFETLDLLVAQIKKDVDQAKNYFKQQGTL